MKDIESSIRGAVADGRLCTDIATSIEATRAAQARLEGDLLREDPNHCVHEALGSKGSKQRERAIEERVGVFRRA